MDVPPSLTKPSTHEGIQIEEIIYSLKQSPRAWF